MTMLRRPGRSVLTFATGLWLSLFLFACGAPVEGADYRELDIEINTDALEIAAALDAGGLFEKAAWHPLGLNDMQLPLE